MVLVGTVLSQNTNWRNTRRAFDNFAPKFQTPAQLVGAHLREIEKLIRPAGLYKAKAKNLREMARIIQGKYGGDLGRILEKPPGEARRELLEFPGVGYKTADCVLLFAGGRDVLPVDVHVARTAKRLGFASLKDSPERVREKLEPLVPKGRRGEAHLLLIELGRRYCRASKPLCGKCPINNLCPKAGLD
jgi:endonuclease-3